MADYFPLLARAIASLPQNTAEARKAVFDRARTALLRQLRGVDPPLPEGEITRERLSLEEAIRRIEAEHAPQDNMRPETAAAEPSEAEPELAEGETEPEAPTFDEEPTAHEPSATVGTDQDGVDHERFEQLDATLGEAEGAAGEALPVEPEDSLPPAAGAAGEPPVRRAALRRGEVRSRDAAKDAARDGSKAMRPSVQLAGTSGASWKKFALWAVLAVLVLAAIVFAVLGLGLFSSGTQTTSQPPEAASSAATDQPKSEDRVASTAGDAVRRAPTPARAVGTERAVLVEESPGGASPLQTFEGTVTWKTETFNAGPGLPPDIGIRGEVVIPERQISMSFVLRRNTDQTLPASHTIEISFKLPRDFAFGGIANVPGVRAKQGQQAQGVPLGGLAVKVNPTLFLVGLSPSPSDRQRNVALLQLYPWLDVPVVYENNKKAAFVFEKGPAGEQAFNDAFSAWGELIQKQPQPASDEPKPNGG